MSASRRTTHGIGVKSESGCAKQRPCPYLLQQQVWLRPSHLNEMEIAGVQLRRSYVIQRNHIMGVGYDLDVGSYLMNVGEHCSDIGKLRVRKFDGIVLGIEIRDRPVAKVRRERKSIGTMTAG